MSTKELFNLSLKSIARTNDWKLKTNTKFKSMCPFSYREKQFTNDN